MDNLKDKFRRFMVGRYGMDELNRFLTIMTAVLIGANLFARSSILFWMELICVILVYGRMFSRNTGRRFQENQRFLRYEFYGKEYVRNLKFRWKEARRYKIFRCPGCGQRIRIPRGHGKVQIHCKSCGNDFLGRS